VEALHELDQELRALNYASKTHKQQQEDKLDNMRAKIEICCFKQTEALEETKQIQKELEAERRKYRVVEEDLER